MTRLSAGGWTIEATRVERGARLRVWRMATLPWSDKVKVRSPSCYSPTHEPPADEPPAVGTHGELLARGCPAGHRLS